MKEITRVHLAKVAYDIELAAKKELEKYLGELRKYAGDDNVLEDIEQRITELLSEQGVQPGGVISQGDVEAVREQLGEPSDFADDVDETMAKQLGLSNGRRLYRDTDDAMLGGVLAGIAKYFDTQTIWVRLVFVILTFASFGTSVFVYGLLWVLMPPAVTPADKLQMAGQPVTPRTLKQLADTGALRGEPLMLRLLAGLLGLGFYLASAGVFLGTIGGMAFAVTNDDFHQSSWLAGFDPSWLGVAAGVIVVIGLLLLGVLFGILGNAFWRRSFNRRTLVSAGIVTLLGLLSVVLVVGGVAFGFGRQDYTQKHMSTSSGAVTNFDVSQRNLLVQYAKGSAINSVSVSYVADGSAVARYDLRAPIGTKVSFGTADGQNTAQVKIPSHTTYYQGDVSLVIHGPSLDALTVGDNMNVSYEAKNSQSLNVTMSQSASSLSLIGSYQSVTIAGSNGSVDMANASVENLVIRSGQGLSVAAGTVRTLDVTQPDVCGAQWYGDDTVVHVDAVSSGELVYNGKTFTYQQTAGHDMGTNCAELEIGEIDD